MKEKRGQIWTADTVFAILVQYATFVASCIRIVERVRDGRRQKYQADVLDGALPLCSQGPTQLLLLLLLLPKM